LQSTNSGHITTTLTSTCAKPCLFGFSLIDVYFCRRGYVVRKAYKLYQLGGVVSEILYSPAAYGLDMSVRNMPKPRARISPQVCLKCGWHLMMVFGGRGAGHERQKHAQAARTHQPPGV
jgi:hypothetical protein